MAADHAFRIRGKLASASPTKSVSPLTRTCPSWTTGLRRGLRAVVLLPTVSPRRRSIAIRGAVEMLGCLPSQPGFALLRIVLHRAIALLLRPADALESRIISSKSAAGLWLGGMPRTVTCQARFRNRGRRRILSSSDTAGAPGRIQDRRSFQYLFTALLLPPVNYLHQVLGSQPVRQGHPALPLQLPEALDFVRAA